jgi:FkbM family methyltransferase
VNFSAIPKGSLFGRLLRWPLRFIPPESEVRILQGRLRGRRWIAGASDHGCWLGSYELAKQQAFADGVREGAVVYDVGAHVGFYTLLASALVGPRGRVVAFEPLPRNLRYLRRHLELNGVANVDLVEAAAGERNGEARFEEGASSSMGRIAAGGTLTVKVVSLDQLHAQGRFPAPDCMKIDVEGGELEVLRGAARVIATAHPVLFLATHSRELHRACLELLRGWGYRLEAIGAAPVEETDELIARR